MEEQLRHTWEQFVAENVTHNDLRHTARYDEIEEERDLLAGELYKTARRVQDLEKQLSNCDGARRYDQERLADCRRANRAQ